MKACGLPDDLPDDPPDGWPVTGLPESDPVFRRLLDGALLFDAEQGCIHHLNETAAVICESWRQGTKEEDIVDLLLQRYTVDAAVAGKQVRMTIAQLQSSASV